MSRPNESGSALAVVLLAMALLVPLGALAVLEANTGLRIGQDLRAEREAFYAADSGLSWAVASLPSDVDDATLLAGPDGFPGTADDGSFPYQPDCSGCNLGPSVRFEVTIARVSADLLVLTSTGVATRGAEQVIQQLIRRAPQPHLPGALYADDRVEPSFGTSDFFVNGLDHGPEDDISAGSGSGPGLPALALPNEAVEEAVRDTLAPDAASRLIGPGSPSVGHDRSVDLEALAWRAAAMLDTVSYDPASLPVDLSLGTSSHPKITVVNGDAVIEGTWSGTGILIVHGQLEVHGRLELKGVILCHEGLVVEESAVAQVHGAALVAGTILDLWGSGGIAACTSCLASIDAAFPAVLPHPFEPLSWRQADSD